MRVIGVSQPINPPANVILLLDSVGSKCATAFTLSTGIGEQHSIAIRQEKFSICAHPLPVVTYAMEEDDRITVVRGRTDEPSPQLDAIPRLDSDILKCSVESTGSSRGLLAPFDGYTQWMKCHLA